MRGNIFLFGIAKPKKNKKTSDLQNHGFISHSVKISFLYLICSIPVCTTVKFASSFASAFSEKC